MFNLCVVARVLWMNSSMYTVLNVGVPVICILVSVHIGVKGVIRYSVKGVI
jgi:hypothetical protein